MPAPTRPAWHRTTIRSPSQRRSWWTVPTSAWFVGGNRCRTSTATRRSIPEVHELETRYGQGSARPPRRRDRDEALRPASRKRDARFAQEDRAAPPEDVGGVRRRDAARASLERGVPSGLELLGDG